MIIITKDGESGTCMKSLGYITGRGFISRIILPVTRWLRAVNAERYMIPAGCHLDIGCGDGYFLRRSKCSKGFGLDKLLGDEVKDRLDFPDSYFDYVTMLAVIEHIPEPQAILREIARVLKPEGRLIITTPEKSADRLLKLYSRNIDEEHESYFDLNRIKSLTTGLFEVVGYHTFIFGLNQAFCLEPARGISLANE